MGWVFSKKRKFYLHDNETLLDGLLRTEHDTPYECRQGYCGTCKMQLIIHSGQVSHTLSPLCHLEPNEVLACCCLADGVVEIVTDNNPNQLSLFDDS